MDLFGDLPAAKNDKKDGGTENDNQVAPNIPEKAMVKTIISKLPPQMILPQAPKPSEKESKKSASMMAFIPSAARVRRRVEPSKRTNTMASRSLVSNPVITTVSPTFTTTYQTETVPDQSQNPKQPINVHQTPSETGTQQEGHEPLQKMQQEWVESEELRMLHVRALEDPYDPLVPNDLLQYWERKSFEKERIQLEKGRQEALEQQEFLREQLQRERMELAQSGNIQQLIEHQHQLSRGRGRGVSNIPAWLLEKQRREAALEQEMMMQPSKKPKN